MDDDVKTVFESYPAAIRERLLALRRMIFEVAAETDGVGDLQETLKWGQISYLTPVTKSGTTIRIDASQRDPDQLVMYVNCQTTLVETFRALYGETFAFEGNRCVKFGENVPVQAVRHCIAMALTYHLDKKRR